MKTGFEAYFRPTSTEFHDLWKTAVFVLDTSVLLNLYEWRRSSADEFFGALEALQDRLWLPHKVAVEFHARRHQKLRRLKEQYEKWRTDARRLLSDLSDEKVHPHVSANAVRRFSEGVDVVIKELEEWSPPDSTDGDEILLRLVKIFDGRTGAAEPSDYSRDSGQQSTAGDSQQEARARHSADELIWEQLLRWATGSARSVIFVTSDTQENWWNKDETRTLGPSIRKLQEFRQKVGKPCYFYKTDKFLEHVRDWLEQPISDETIREAQHSTPLGPSSGTKPSLPMKLFGPGSFDYETPGGFDPAYLSACASSLIEECSPQLIEPLITALGDRARFTKGVLDYYRIIRSPYSYQPFDSMFSRERGLDHALGFQHYIFEKLVGLGLIRLERQNEVLVAVGLRDALVEAIRATR